MKVQLSSTEARDTTGLFNAGGDHSKGEYVKTVEPPGDTSYILGPMAAMYYTWSYPWTMIGYIRESDRRMVNLGRIDGKLSDWDQSRHWIYFLWAVDIRAGKMVF